MQVFEGLSPSDPSPARLSEGTGSFLARVSGDFWDQVRDLIEDWFSRYCREEQANLRSRLRSADNQQFQSAFFELYLHESLLRSGYSVTCHPLIASEDRVPDFLAVKEGLEFYLEAHAPAASGQAIAASNRRSAVYDVLNRLESPNFFLCVDIESQGATDLPTGALRRNLTDWLATLDPDTVEETLQRNATSPLPERLWQDAGWVLRFRPLPKSAESRGAGTELRTVGVYDIGADFVDGITVLRKALQKKGGAYGRLASPYIVALATPGPLGDDISVRNALFGTEGARVAFDASGVSEVLPTRAPDGYWLGNAGWRRRHVSGVLVAHDVHPARVTRVVPTLWEHPTATLPSPSLAIWRRAVLSGTELLYIEQEVAPSELFHLPEPWPKGERFPR